MQSKSLKQKLIENEQGNPAASLNQQVANQQAANNAVQPLNKKQYRQYLESDQLFSRQQYQKQSANSQQLNQPTAQKSKHVGSLPKEEQHSYLKRIKEKDSSP